MKRNDEIIIDDTEINIAYERPISTHRIYSAIVDYFLLFLLFLVLLFSCDSIIRTTGVYKDADQTLNDIRLSSGIYEYDNETNRIALITEKYTIASEGNASQVENQLSKGMDKFIEFCKEIELKEEIKDFGKDMEDDYNEYRETLTNGGNKMFEKTSDGRLRKTATGGSYTDYIDKCYKPYINSYAKPNLLRVPSYYDANKTLSLLMLSIEIPIPLIFSIIIVFYIPGLIFRRGRKSIGKLLFKVGIVNKDFLNPNFWQYTSRFILILFETILFIPAVISFTMMVFSKKQLTIHDLLLKMNCVDTRENKVYFNKLDAFIEKKNKISTVDFKHR